MTLDDARKANPELGFGLYAIEPNGHVTLEVYTPDGQTFSWTGPTEAHVLALAFPPDAVPAPEENVADPAPEQPTTSDIFG